MSNTPRRAGRHFLQIPGPTPVPDRILRAMDMPVIDHRGPDFKALGLKVLSGIKTVFKTASPVIIYPSSGTGAWEAALLNTLSPGDKVLMYETGHFATLWKSMATKLGLQAEFIASDWRSGADATAIEARLREDKGHTIKAVCVVHNETSTGAVSHIDEVRRAIDAAKHPALLMVDTISSLASIDYRHDEWGVDVTVGGSQKGLMLPPGLGFNARERQGAGRHQDLASCPNPISRGRTCWAPTRRASSPTRPPPTCSTAWPRPSTCCTRRGWSACSPATTGMRRACAAPCAPGASRSGARTRSITRPRSPPSCCPTGHNADAFRKTALEHFDVSLGTGLSKIAGKVFRIGHLGDTNDLTMIATLAGVEMGLKLAGVPHKPEGVRAAMDYFAQTATPRGD